MGVKAVEWESVDWINVAGCCYHDSEHLGFKNVGIF
jgi:hypothetical protein